MQIFMLAELIQDMVMEKTINPYTYVDWISRQWTVDKLPKDYRSFKKEIEEKLTMLIKHARSITLKRNSILYRKKF